MDRFAANQELQQKLERAGLPFHSVKVFGAIRCNVHVICDGRTTAQKWAELLVSLFNVKVSLVPHRRDAVDNKGTCLLPTQRDGFLVAIAA